MRRGRNAEGVEGEENGERVFSSLADYGDWGNVVSFPSWVRSGAPAENDFTRRDRTSLIVVYVILFNQPENVQ